MCPGLFQEEGSMSSFYCMSLRVVLKEEIIQKRIKGGKENKDTGDTTHLYMAHLRPILLWSFFFTSNPSRVCNQPIMGL